VCGERKSSKRDARRETGFLSGNMFYLSCELTRRPLVLMFNLITGGMAVNLAERRRFVCSRSFPENRPVTRSRLVYCTPRIGWLWYTWYRERYCYKGSY
jgi:hypothetical protein